MTTPLQSGFSRVFLIDGGARPDHEPEFMSCMRAGSDEFLEFPISQEELGKAMDGLFRKKGISNQQQGR